MERALETRRIKLLRLLAGWFFLAGFVSRGAFVLPLPRDVRRFLDSLVIRAELAAQYLLYASVRLRGGNARVIFGALPAPWSVRDVQDVPSVEALCRRMLALRDLLENLPREARRLVRKHADRRAGRLPRAARTTRAATAPVIGHPARAPRAERPPDIVGAMSRKFTSPRSRAGGEGGWAERMRDLRVQFGIPIEVIHPAFVQVIWREFPTDILQFHCRWLVGFAVQHNARSPANILTALA